MLRILWTTFLGVIQICRNFTFYVSDCLLVLEILLKRACFATLLPYKICQVFMKIVLSSVWKMKMTISCLVGSRYVTLNWACWIQWQFNTLRPRQNGRHFADDVFKCIFLNENVWILLKISLKFIPKSPINNIPSFIQIMAWRRPGDKSLSEPIMVSLLTHICVARPQWVKIAFAILYDMLTHWPPGNCGCNL